MPVILRQQGCNASVLVLQCPPVDLGWVCCQHNLHSLQEKAHFVVQNTSQHVPWLGETAAYFYETELTLPACRQNQRARLERFLGQSGLQRLRQSSWRSCLPFWWCAHCITRHSGWAVFAYRRLHGVLFKVGRKTCGEFQLCL